MRPNDQPGTRGGRKASTPRPVRALTLLVAGLALSLLASGRASAPSPPAAPPAGPDPAQALAQAAELVRAQDWSAALASARSALQYSTDPDQQGRARFLVGYSFYQLKDYDDARLSLHEASRLAPELSFHGLYYAALSFQEEEKFADASLLWQKLLEGNPPGDLEGRALMQLMRCHRKSDNADAADAVISRIRALPPSQRDPMWNRELDFTRGWVKLEKQDSAGARSIFKELWIEYPESFWADQAQKYLIGAEAAPLLPAGETAAVSSSDRLERIRNLIGQNLPGKALDELKPIIAAAEKAEKKKGHADRMIPLYRIRAEAYDQKRDLKRALADYQRVQKLIGPESVELTYLMASCYLRMGRHSEALVKYRHIWTKYPRNSFATKALYYAARMMKMDEDWDGAEQAYKRLVQTYPHSSLRPEALFQLAWLCYLNKDYKKARDYLAQAPRRPGSDEYNARVIYWKAEVLHKLGDDDGAAALEKQILDSYWDTCYAFYLVMVRGMKWPYGPGGKELPPPDPQPPLEYRVATTLYALGLDYDADGQLESLAEAGRLPENLAFAVATMRLKTGNYSGAQRIAARRLHDRLATPPPGEAEAWRLAYPRAFADYVRKYAADYSLDPLLVYSVMRAESTYRPDIRSSAGALGLMQVMPATGRLIARNIGDKNFTTASLYDPEQSVRYGCYYLSARLARFSDGGSGPKPRLQALARALASYNAGPDRVSQWDERASRLGLSPQAFIEEIPFRETNTYVKRILGFYLIYLIAYQHHPDQATTPVAVPNDAAAPVAGAAGSRDHSD